MEQVSTGSPDLTAAIIRLEHQLVLVVSVFIAEQDDESLQDACATLRRLINDAQRKKGLAVEVVLGGDFNRHDWLWGGDDVSLVRQGEAHQIIDNRRRYQFRAV